MTESHTRAALASSLEVDATAVPIEVSVVMPCLDEARTVGRCIAKAMSALDRLGVAGEVIVADNGSTDGSVGIARSHGVRVVKVAMRGYGCALQEGIAAARGSLVIMGDADDSYDFSQLTPFLDRLRAGDDLVVGNRFQGGIHPGAMPWLHRYIGNPLLTAILNLFFHSKVHDTQCGLRGFRRTAYDAWNMISPGMEFASEMVVKACLHHHRVSEVPTPLFVDGRDRRPHLRSFRDGWRHLRFLLLMCPMWLYLIPSILLLGGGLGLMVWLSPGLQVVDGLGFGMHTMLLGALCVLLGYQNLWLWAFAKSHGITSGLLPGKVFPTGLQRFASLELGLAVGVFLLVAGFASNLWLVWEWRAVHLGALEPVKTMPFAIWGLTALVLGVQTIYGSFLLSIIWMPRKKA